VGKARGQLLGRALLGALAQGTHTLEAKLKWTDAHDPRDRRAGSDLKQDGPGG
jgi:hypothetical protein